MGKPGFYIQFSLDEIVMARTAYYSAPKRVWRRAVWPVIFDTYELAQAALNATKPGSWDAVPGRPRIRSASIERVRTR